MTWAKNYADRNAATTVDGQRAKRVNKICAMCPAAISNAKTYCGPCYDKRLQANIAANRHRYRKPKKDRS